MGRLERKFLWGCTSLAGALVVFLSSLVWAKVDSTEYRIDVLEVKHEDDKQLLQEVRADVKELLGSMRRLEGNQRAALSP